jgi:hypothetical protein
MCEWERGDVTADADAKVAKRSIDDPQTARESDGVLMRSRAKCDGPEFEHHPVRNIEGESGGVFRAGGRAAYAPLNYLAW